MDKEAIKNLISWLEEAGDEEIEQQLNMRLSRLASSRPESGMKSRRASRFSSSARPPSRAVSRVRLSFIVAMSEWEDHRKIRLHNLLRGLAAVLAELGLDDREIARRVHLVLAPEGGADPGHPAQAGLGPARHLGSVRKI